MRDTTANRQLLNRLEGLCQGTPYKMHIWEAEGFITPHLSIREDAPEYTPAFYLYDDTGYCAGFRLGVQTTSYGVLESGAAMAAAQGLMAAAKLAEALGAELRATGHDVRRM